jgi:tetratricopeptide (TPR) repeat protein
MGGARYETASVAGLEDPTGWSAIRKRFGVASFGVNAWTAHEAGGRIIPEHDETPSAHEELYLVTAGHATFTVDDDEVDAPAGTVVFVRDPAARRGAVARTDGTTVLAVGGRPGDAYRPRSWELRIPALLDAHEHEKAKRVLTEALERYEDRADILYNLACAEALLGQSDESVEHLAAAVAEHSAYAEYAREDPDFESIRADPRFAAIVGG